MAQYNQILVSRFNDHLRRLLGIKVPGGDAVSALAPEIMPAGDIFSLQQYPEHFGLQGIRLWSQHLLQGSGGAGTFATVGVRNNSQAALVVVTAVSLDLGASAQLFMTGPTQLTGVVPATGFRDSRVGNLLTQVGFNVPAALFPGTLLDKIFAPGPFIGLPVVLFPGFELDAQLANAAAPIEATFVGYERQFEPTELTQVS